jgi:hypothetical protein
MKRAILTLRFHYSKSEQLLELCERLEKTIGVSNVWILLEEVLPDS